MTGPGTSDLLSCVDPWLTDDHQPPFDRCSPGRGERSISLPNGPDGARALAELLNEARVQTRDDVIEIAASRFERRLADEVGRLRAEMGAFEGRITRWMFVFWIGQIGALLGILFAFFRA
jgi:hypothetical protein